MISDWIQNGIKLRVYYCCEIRTEIFREFFFSTSVIRSHTRKVGKCGQTYLKCWSAIQAWLELKCLEVLELKCIFWPSSACCWRRRPHFETIDEGINLTMMSCDQICTINQSLYSETLFEAITKIYILYSTGYSLNIVFFSRILKSLPPLPRQHSAAIGCTKKLPGNRSDCTLALRWELWRSLTAM